MECHKFPHQSIRVRLNPFAKLVWVIMRSLICIISHVGLGFLMHICLLQTVPSISCAESDEFICIIEYCDSDSHICASVISGQKFHEIFRPDKMKA